MYGRLSNVVRGNDRSVINQIETFMGKPYPIDTGMGSGYYQQPAIPEKFGMPVDGTMYNAWQPLQMAAPPSGVPQYAAPLIAPQVYVAPEYNYSRTRGWEGYAHSLDQYSTYGPNQPAENAEEQQPQVISRGFMPKKKKKHPPHSTSHPMQPPTQPSEAPPIDSQAPPQTGVPFPPFLPGTKLPQHSYTQPPYFGYPTQDYAYQWNIHPMQSNTVPTAPVIPHHIQPNSDTSNLDISSTSGNNNKVSGIPAGKEMFGANSAKAKKWKSERVFNRERSNSDAMNETRKEEENSKHMSSTDCSIDSLGGIINEQPRENQRNVEENKEKAEEEKIIANVADLSITSKPKKKHKPHKKINNSSRVKWVPKKPHPDLSIKIEENNPKKDKEERFLNKVQNAHDMQMQGKATEEDTLLTVGPRTYYNKGGIATPKRVVPGQIDSLGSGDKNIVTNNKNEDLIPS